MQPGTFPEGIEKAYERVAVRVFKESSPSKRKDARLILGWIACAGRLLRWREIQSVFCITPSEGAVEYEEGKLRVTCKELCRSLVDVHSGSGNRNKPDDIIKIVHDTARDHAIRGYYALQDYTVPFWFYHTMECIKLPGKLDNTIWQEVITSARDFLNSYTILLNKGEIRSGENQAVAKTLKELPEDDRERSTYLNIEFRTNRIRKVLEKIQYETLDHITQEILMNLHGTTKIYKCSKPWCEFFSAGYERMEDRKLHLDRHDLPFCCTFEECPAHLVGFDTQSKRNQHVERYHQDATSSELEFPKTRPKGAPTFYDAIVQGDIAAIRAILYSGVDINKPNAWNNWTGGPLYVAAESGQIEVCKLLLENGAIVDYTIITGGGTPLHAATRSGKIEVCKLLLENGADIARLYHGETALHVAVLGDSLEMVRLFLSHLEQCGSDVIVDIGMAPFLHACQKGNLAIVKMLFETGKVNVNRSNNRKTTLWHAIKGGNFRVVQYLLEETPIGPVSRNDLTVAVTSGHKSVANILLPAIANSSRNNSPDNPYEDGFSPNCVTLGNDWCVIYNQHAPCRQPNIDLVHTVKNLGTGSQVVFSSCGKYFVLFYDQSVFEIYDAISMNQVNRFQTIIYPIQCVFLGSEGKRLVIWDTVNGRLDTKLELEQPAKAVHLTEDGHALIALREKEAVRLLKVKDNHSNYGISLSMDCPIITVAFSSSGELVVTGSVDGTDHVQGCPFTFDSNWVLSSYQGGGVEFLDTQNNTSRLLLQLSEDDDICIAVSPTQALFATCTKGKLHICPGSDEPNETGFAVTNNTNLGLFNFLGARPHRTILFAAGMRLYVAHPAIHVCYLVEGWT
ncbi:hypothetical protein Daesc_007283 [Daldinia eschscholtzii]|uniref:C2H2-type domain-containing protein n=1 Tax=Daldinia eschscholtzii TaxID=292717 RepID=A0AAX6MDI7_9PEZI